MTKNVVQTGRKGGVRVQGKRELHNWSMHTCTCTHLRAQTHTFSVPFSPQLWSDALVAATLASLDMQSGPISSTVSRR